MPHKNAHQFTAPAEEHEFAAFLFDMDGTIIDSTPAIVKYWHQVGKEIGVDGDSEFGSRHPPSSKVSGQIWIGADTLLIAILETSHGRRSIDVLRILCPERANWDCESATPIRLKARSPKRPLELTTSLRRL